MRDNLYVLMNQVQSGEWAMAVTCRLQRLLPFQSHQHPKLCSSLDKTGRAHVILLHACRHQRAASLPSVRLVTVAYELFK